jgi:hypothetical protein
MESIRRLRGITAAGAALALLLLPTVAPAELAGRSGRLLPAWIRRANAPATRRSKISAS